MTPSRSPRSLAPTVRARGLSRRTLLRGAGTALALPFLEAMVPARRTPAAPTRALWVYVPNGVDPEGWGWNADGTPRSALAPLQDLRDDWILLRGLTADKARANGDGPGDHARAAAAFLTGAQPLKEDGRVFVGVSADQLAARHLGHATRLRSLVVGGEPARSSGQCDSGYACAYSGNLSWTTPRSPVTKESDPRRVFERLTSNDLASRDPGQARRRRSVLDLVRGEARGLSARLAPGDRHRLDEYLEGLRELERRLERLREDPGTATREAPPAPTDHVERMRLHYELLALALSTDATRIATYLVANEGSNRRHAQLGLADGHHSLSHHRADAAMREGVRAIDRFHAERFAEFLRRLDAVEEAGGRLLDHCWIVYGSGIRDGNRHDHHDLPLLLAGHGGARLASGDELAFAPETPVGELHLAVLARLGLEVERLGDAERPLGKLTVRAG